MSTELDTGALLQELERLADARSSPERARRAWEILAQALADPSYPVLVDFALERGLIESLVSEPTKKRRGERVASSTWINPVDGSEMVWIPAGSCFLGPDRKRVEIAGFSLARFPVTNQQFKQFLDETSYRPPEQHPDPETFLQHWQPLLSSFPAGLERHPVVWVSYIDALHYCRWAGLTLPTEYLWEKGARGTDGRAYPWGNHIPTRYDEEELTNVRAKGTLPAGSFPRTRTPYGCEDLVGNVSQWCQMVEGDDWSVMPGLPSLDCPNEQGQAYAAVRGACFLRLHGRRMTAAHRRKLSITRRNYWTGFRPAHLGSWKSV